MGIGESGLMAITNPWNLGSVSAEVISLYPNLPTNLSGTNMNNTTLGAIQFLNNYAGLDLGSTGIAQQYHNIIIYKVLVDVARASALNGNTTDSVSIGDFSADNTNSTEIVQTYSELLKDELQAIGKRSSYYRTY